MEIWQQERSNAKVGGRTRTWMPTLQPAMSKKLLCLPRIDLGICMRWITGFCNLMRHRHKKRNSIPYKCRLCNQHMETPEHLSFYCPRLQAAREECFLTRDGPPDKWTPKQILLFVETPICQQLLEDKTDYQNMSKDGSSLVGSSGSSLE